MQNIESACIWSLFIRLIGNDPADEMIFQDGLHREGSATGATCHRVVEAVTDSDIEGPYLDLMRTACGDV